MRKLILIAHISLDGFVALKNGELTGFDPSKENLDFVNGLTDTADAAMFGRVSYQLLDDYWPNAHSRPDTNESEIKYSHWYNAAEKIVLSKTLSATDKQQTTIISDNIADEVIKIKQQPGKDILLFGSPSAFQSLIADDLVDGFWILLYPATFGEGIPLFVPTEKRLKLKLESTTQLSKGELALYYTPVR